MNVQLRKLKDNMKTNPYKVISKETTERVEDMYKSQSDQEGRRHEKTTTVERSNPN
jgi:hypothetical protein